MSKSRFHTAFVLTVILVSFVSCTSTKNTRATRWYHSFNTRYNVYFNGDEAYKAALKTQQEGYQETYSDFIYMYPVSSLPKDKDKEGGPFDKSIEKAAKAIKTHSIKTKPERKAGKKNDPKYQEFMSREEYNPFLYNAWLLMGKSQFHNGDFLTAASTFSYTARHYSTQPNISSEAKIWQARCYAEMGWYYEADDILSKLNNDNLPKNKSDWFSSIYADFLIKQKRYAEAVPYLEIAIKAEKNRFQKQRQKYLLGQIYTDLGQKQKAYKVFGEVAGSTAPYSLQFSAKIRQTEVFSEGNVKKVSDMLNKMSKSKKNKDYLDQVYYAWGNVYMTVPDTAKAIEKYKLGVEESTQNGFEKALNQICLGDIYFTQRKYIEAQPCYSEALGQIKKEYKDYPRVSKRSEVLDELVVYAEAVHLQDSLQVLARMPEEERLAAIDKLIADYIKKEEEEKKRAEREEYLAQQESNRDNMSDFSVGRKSQQTVNTPTIQTAGADPFYFYNPQTVAQGKTEFQRKWGKRKLEDNWRLRNKATQLDDELAFGSNANEQESVENVSDSVASVQKTPEELEAANDPKKREFYLQQIPLTEEDIDASNEILMDGFYNMGGIYKDKLEDYSLAIETFVNLNNRFPDNEFKLDSYYQMYLMYLKMNDIPMAELYKSKIRAEFPKSDLAVAMADPNYEYNMRMIDFVQDSIYQRTYEYYTNGNVSGIRRNYQTAAQKYPQSELMPKFMFLNALSYVQTNEPEMFKQKLKELLEKYPDADVSVLAGGMMKGLLRGLTLSGDGNLARGGLFNLRFGAVGEDGEPLDSTIVFSEERNTPHMLLLVYPANTVNGNLILFAVAEFNFSNFMVNDFDLHEVEFDQTNMLQIRGFNNFNEIIQYYRMINQPTGYMKDLDRAVIVVPISTDNYDILMKGKSLNEYIEFYEEHFGNETPHLIEKWKTIQEEEIEEQSEESDILQDPVEIFEKQEKEILEEGNTLPVDVPELEKQEEEKIEMIFPDTIISIVKDTIVSVEKDTVSAVKPIVTEDEVMDAANKAAEKVSKTADSVNETLDEIANDPIRGIQNLFSKRKKSNAIDEYVKEQEREEKARQKELEEERKAAEKAQRELEKQKEKERQAELKRQKEEEKALLKAKKEQEKALEEQKKMEQKAKEDARKQLAKEKEDARKQRAEELKARQKQREEDRKAKEKARKEAQKQREKEREAARKQKEAERKAKSK